MKISWYLYIYPNVVEHLSNRLYVKMRRDLFGYVTNSLNTNIIQDLNGVCVLTFILLFVDTFYV